MNETAGNRWCSTCRFRPPVKKFPMTPPQFADVSTCDQNEGLIGPVPIAGSCAGTMSPHVAEVSGHAL